MIDTFRVELVNNGQYYYNDSIGQLYPYPDNRMKQLRIAYKVKGATRNFVQMVPLYGKEPHWESEIEWLVRSSLDYIRKVERDLRHAPIT